MKISSSMLRSSYDVDKNIKNTSFIVQKTHLHTSVSTKIKMIQSLYCSITNTVLVWFEGEDDVVYNQSRRRFSKGLYHL